MRPLLRYAATATPWPRVTVAAGLVVLLMDVVRRWPWQMWPLQGVAVGLLAGAVAWCMDETAAGLVDVAPRPLVWRTAARLGGIAMLAAAWWLAVWWARDSLFGHPEAVARQGIAAMLAAAAWTVSRRAAGEAHPGLRLAVVVVPAVTVWALVRPADKQLPVFPYASGGMYGDWEASTVGWTVLAVIATGWLVITLSEVAWSAGTPRLPRVVRLRGRSSDHRI